MTITNKERCRIWSNKNRELKRALDKSYRERKYYDGKREQVLERDNWMCCICGMSQEQHLILFNRGLTVHHKDRKGYYSEEKNNNLDNLQTLCLRCHAKLEAGLWSEKTK